MNATVLATSPTLAGHLRIGCSTGYFVEYRGDWPSLIEQATALSLRAIELAALSEEELPGLLAYLDDEPSLPCDYVSVHAPSKGRRMAEEELVSLLDDLPPWIETVVAHPDTFEVPERWNRLGRRLAVENMDRRKPAGRTAQEMATVFAMLPDASLCFDIAHSWAIDSSMAEGQAILDRFGCRLRQLHVSSLDSAQHHVPLTQEDEELFSSLLDRCRDVPWILEAAPRST
ncbi:MAG: sugar phosphate isomerase/epimerase [Solirubrobacteraceae bacterium MAG38_C4-C5]|nr:sugar phosphate isomerase/epimerase [Candidatus Siliceabacter maunaloa]